MKFGKLLEVYFLVRWMKGCTVHSKRFTTKAEAVTFRDQKPFGWIIEHRIYSNGEARVRHELHVS